jgi:hypothetical protein
VTQRPSLTRAAAEFAVAGRPAPPSEALAVGEARGSEAEALFEAPTRGDLLRGRVRSVSRSLGRLLATLREGATTGGDQDAAGDWSGSDELRPPSTGRITPVTQRAAGLAR